MLVPNERTPRLTVALESILHTLEELEGDDCLMLTAVDLVLVLDLADIGRVGQ